MQAVVLPLRMSLTPAPPFPFLIKRIFSSHRLLTTPIELIKIQQQKQQQQLSTSETGRASPTTARALALHVYRAGGIRALYRGLSATIWRDVGGYGLYFYGVRVCACKAAHPSAA